MRETLSFCILFFFHLQSLPELFTKAMRRRRRPIRRINSDDDFGKHRRYGQLLDRHGHTHHLCCSRTKRSSRKSQQQSRHCACRNLFLPTHKTPHIQKRLTLRKYLKRTSSLGSPLRSKLEKCVVENRRQILGDETQERTSGANVNRRSNAGMVEEPGRRLDSRIGDGARRATEGRGFGLETKRVGFKGVSCDQRVGLSLGMVEPVRGDAEHPPSSARPFAPGDRQ